jgi:hypothetical protein
MKLGIDIERWQVLMLIMVAMVVLGLALEQHFTTLVDALLL